MATPTMASCKQTHQDIRIWRSDPSVLHAGGRKHRECSGVPDVQVIRDTHWNTARVTQAHWYSSRPVDSVLGCGGTLPFASALLALVFPTRCYCDTTLAATPIQPAYLYLEPPSHNNHEYSTNSRGDTPRALRATPHSTSTE